jgi:hypothetical protein
MFRRNPFRRPFRPTAPIGEAGRLALRQANQLKDTGVYTQAADIFESVARQMENRRRPNRAALLYLQAGHCHLLAAQPELALQQAKRGCSILAQVQHWQAYSHWASLMIQELNRLGYTKETTEFQTWLKQTAPIQPVHLPGIGLDQPAQKPTVRLPSKCPFCGATLRSDMAERIDGASVECPYCGSAVQSE